MDKFVISSHPKITSFLWVKYTIENTAAIFKNITLDVCQSCYLQIAAASMKPKFHLTRIMRLGQVFIRMDIWRI